MSGSVSLLSSVSLPEVAGSFPEKISQKTHHMQLVPNQMPDTQKVSDQLENKTRFFPQEMVETKSYKDSEYW